MKILGFTLATVGECSGIPAEVITEWTAKTPVKTRKVQPSRCATSSRSSPASPAANGPARARSSGTFDSKYKKLSISADHGYTKPLSEGLVFDCESREGVGLNKAGKAGGKSGNKSKGRGGGR